MSQRGIIEYEITPTEIVTVIGDWEGVEHLLEEEPTGSATLEGEFEEGPGQNHVVVLRLQNLPDPPPGAQLSAAGMRVGGYLIEGDGVQGVRAVVESKEEVPQKTMASYIASASGSLVHVRSQPDIRHPAVFDPISPWTLGDLEDGRVSIVAQARPALPVRITLKSLRLLLQFSTAPSGPGPMQPELTLETQHFKSGDQTPIVGTLTNRGEPLAFTTATLRVSRGARTQPVLDATIFTDDQGRFAHPWLVPDPGTYIVEATVTVPGAPGQQITAPASGYGTIRVDRRIISGGGGGILL